ncbi:hypothetical protein DNTS_032605 [Danionella cerebrum]|uniref:Cortactin-binding protein-2 N-terminal domain-containing protein n=1 Tax=Danionella cerebrum TaxID=2873325 RepID=A0A553PYB7_9TELE|nr:hypothetical protein DNTS_032605 [Danionella translucida]
MRSCSSTLEEEENLKQSSPRKSGVRRHGRRDAKETLSSKQKSGERDLTWDDLLFLLSMLEGELQARDEVIAVLRAEKLDLALLEAKYGFLTPGAMRALQRDSINEDKKRLEEDVYQRPITELERVVQSHSECYRRMLDQLLMVERSHRNTLDTLVHEKQKHTHSSRRSLELTSRLERERDSGESSLNGRASDDVTFLLKVENQSQKQRGTTQEQRSTWEQYASKISIGTTRILEQERLKQLIYQEKTHQERKEEENNRRVSKLKAELTQLKSFTLLVVDDHQQLSKQLKTQLCRVQESKDHSEKLETQTSTDHELLEHSKEFRTQDQELKTQTGTIQDLQEHSEDLKNQSGTIQDQREHSEELKTQTGTIQNLQEHSEEFKTQTDTIQDLHELSEQLETRANRDQKLQKTSDELKTQCHRDQKLQDHPKQLRTPIRIDQELQEHLHHLKTQVSRDQKHQEHPDNLTTAKYQDLQDNSEQLKNQTYKDLGRQEYLELIKPKTSRDQKLQEHSQEMQVESAKAQNREEEWTKQLERVAQEQAEQLQSMNARLESRDMLTQELQVRIAQLEQENTTLRRAQEELRDQGMEGQGSSEAWARKEEYRGLMRKLEEQVGFSQSFRDQLEILKKSLLEMERVEQAFGSTKEEAKSLRSALDRERGNVKHLNNQLEAMRSRLRELDELETGLEKRETAIKEDLGKMKRLTALLVEERKGTSEKLKDMEERMVVSSKKLQEGQEKMNTLTEKLVEESQRNLQSKGQLEEKICMITREREEMKARLRAEEEKSSDLQDKLCMMRKRLQSLESLERETLKSKARVDECKSPGSFCYPPQEDNRVKDLTQELEQLRRKLTEKKISEDVLKNEDAFEALEKKLINEQERTKALMEELEASRNELSKYKRSNKEEINEELAIHKLSEKEMKQEQLNNRLSEKEECIMNLHQISSSSEFVEKLSEEYMLKEKLHKISQESMVKAQLSAVQRKLGLMEIRNRDLVREMDVLTRELERYRRFSRSLRPGMNGRRLSDLQMNEWRISDLQLSSKEVQTDPQQESSPSQANAIFSESPLPPKDGMDSLDRMFSGEPLQIIIRPDQNHNTALLGITRHKNSPTGPNYKSFNTSIGNNQSNPKAQSSTSNQNQLQNSPSHPSLKPQASSFSNLKHPQLSPQNTPSKSSLPNTSDHTASCSSQSENTNLRSESPGSFRSTAVIPTSGAALKQRIRILQNQISPPVKTNCDAPLDPLSVSQCSPSPDRALSPVQIVSISTSAPDPAELSETHKVFCMSPEMQNGWSQNLISTEENQIHIRLGKPCILPLLGNVRAAGVCVSQRTPAMGNNTSLSRGNNINNNNKPSSILVKPSASHITKQTETDKEPQPGVKTLMVNLGVLAPPEFPNPEDQTPPANPQLTDSALTAMDPLTISIHVLGGYLGQELWCGAALSDRNSYELVATSDRNSGTVLLSRTGTLMKWWLPRAGTLVRSRSLGQELWCGAALSDRNSYEVVATSDRNSYEVVATSDRNSGAVQLC